MKKSFAVFNHKSSLAVGCMPQLFTEAELTTYIRFVSNCSRSQVHDILVLHPSGLLRFVKDGEVDQPCKLTFLTHVKME